MSEVMSLSRYSDNCSVAFSTSFWLSYKISKYHVNLLLVLREKYTFVLKNKYNQVCINVVCKMSSSFLYSLKKSCPSNVYIELLSYQMVHQLYLLSYEREKYQFMLI